MKKSDQRTRSAGLSTLLLIGLPFLAACQGCHRSHPDGVVIQASPEFIAEEKAERARIEAERAAEQQ